MNIIVRMPNWVGDLVMATPILEDLRKKFPEASITAMCRKPVCELLKEDPAIDELFCFNKISNSFLKREQRRDIVSKIQEGKFDLGILLTNSFSSAWLFWQGRVKKRMGFAGNFRKLLLTDRAALSIEKMHQVDQYKQILKPLGIEPSNTLPRLIVSDAELQEAKDLLTKMGYEQGKKLVGISPFAAYGPAKQWPLDRYRMLTTELSKEDLFIIVFGDASCENEAKKMCQGLNSNVINVTGLTNLRELMSLISLCDAFVTNDSGPMHIASAFQIPLLALFGSTDDRLTGPCSEISHVISKKVSCSPCFKRTCPIDFRCMMEIDVDEVKNEVLKLLNV